MQRTYFFHKQTKKYIVIVGSLFDSYHILKNGTFIKIPVSYTQKNKLIQRYLRRDVSFKGVQMTLPRISYEFTNFYYDHERKFNRIHKYVSDIDSGNKKTQYTPVPYNIDIEVSIIANKNNDAAQIVEQILPKFTPDVKISTNLIPENDINMDISLCLNSVYVQDTVEGLLEDERFITYGLNFTLKAFYFREINESKIILEEIANFYDFDDPTAIQFSITATANTI